MKGRKAVWVMLNTLLKDVKGLKQVIPEEALSALRGLFLQVRNCPISPKNRNHWDQWFRLGSMLSFDNPLF